ncbi:Sulfatase N-terminal domain-containing protein [Plasmodiophora brassicae]
MWRGWTIRPALATVAFVVFAFTITRLSWEFYLTSGSPTWIADLDRDPVPRSIWAHADLRDGPCPVTIPSEPDATFAQLWKRPDQIAPCPSHTAARASRLTRSGLLQAIPGACSSGNLTYWTTDGIRSSAKKRLGLDQVPVDTTSENVFVECRFGRQNVSHDWHLRVVPKKDSQPASAGRTRHVIYILVDSLTREHALRALPQTIQALSHSMSHALVDFTRFNAVGKGTKMNFTPVMMGVSSKEFTDDTNNTMLTISERYRRAGYVTAFIEEACIKNTGSMGRILRKKVKEELTPDEVVDFQKTYAAMSDHTVGNVMCDIMDHMHVLDFFSQSTVNQICYAGRHMHHYLFDYMAQVRSVYKERGRSTFTIMKTNEAHEKTYLRVTQLDPALAAFLNSVDDDTTVIVAGDHGIGYGDLSETMTLTIEYNLPALFLWVPRRDLSAATAANLAVNRHKLITGVDVHATLVDLIAPPLPSNRVELSWTRGRSAFREPIPDRSCKEQGIPSNRCSCSVYTQENPDDPLWKLIGRELVRTINGATAPWRATGCLLLELHRLTRIHHIRGSLKVDELEPEGQLFQVSAEVRADGIAAIEQFQFEIMSRVTWQRPNPDERFVTSIKIWSMDNNTSSRPFVLYGSPKTLGIQIGWNATLLTATRYIRYKFIDQDGNVAFSQKTVVQGNWTTSLSTVTAAHTFLSVGRWTFLVSDEESSRLEGVAQIVVLGASKVPDDFLTTHWDIVTTTRVSQYSPYASCVPPGAPNDKCICRLPP